MRNWFEKKKPLSFSIQTLSNKLDISVLYNKRLFFLSYWRVHKGGKVSLLTFSLFFRFIQSFDDAPGFPLFSLFLLFFSPFVYSCLNKREFARIVAYWRCHVHTKSHVETTSFMYKNAMLNLYVHAHIKRKYTMHNINVIHTHRTTLRLC